MANQEFKATHRYNGLDVGVFLFAAGDEVQFIRDMTPEQDGWDEELTDLNGVYVDAHGNEQYVEYTCMEAI